MAYVQRANPPLCQYTGKVALTLVTQVEGKPSELRVKGLLKKECSGDALFKILHPLGGVVMEIQHTAGVTKMFEKGREITEEHPGFVSPWLVRHILNILEVPAALPGYSDTVRQDEEGNYLFSAGDMELKADAAFKVQSIITPTFALRYRYNGGVLTDIQYTDMIRQAEVAVAFSDVWRGRD